MTVLLPLCCVVLTLPGKVKDLNPREIGPSCSVLGSIYQSQVIGAPFLPDDRRGMTSDIPSVKEAYLWYKMEVLTMGQHLL